MAHDSPCTRDCPDRSPTCHGTCELYAQYSKEKEAERFKRFQRNNLTHTTGRKAWFKSEKIEKKYY